ncbi:Methyltransferase-like protein 21D [Podila epicladia]|nr:Methyltransferase-like protein 21D [Podila epicladia]KAG0083988.1 Methyltransferase-like protein 21D [Podila epicladia]
MTLARDNIDHIFTPSTNQCLWEGFNYLAPSHLPSHQSQISTGAKAARHSRSSKHQSQSQGRSGSGTRSGSISGSGSGSVSGSGSEPVSGFVFGAPFPQPSDGCKLFRVLAKGFLHSEITEGEWKTIYLELVDEFKNFKGLPDLSLDAGQDVIPIDCHLLFEENNSDSGSGGQDPNNTIIDHHNATIAQQLTLQVREMQSTQWNDAESLPFPGIGRNLSGGLEFRILRNDVRGCSRGKKMPSSCWIKISCPAVLPQIGTVVPLVLGPFSIKTLTTSSVRDFSTADCSHEIYRPIQIHALEFVPGPGSTTLASDAEVEVQATTRTMLLKEIWNNFVPQGRIWDSAFVMNDYFSKVVYDGVDRGATPLFARKRILDLSAGTGVLGLCVAGLAQLEQDASVILSLCPTAVLPRLSSRCPSTAAPLRSGFVHYNKGLAPHTSVIMTDLDEAMGLLKLNIQVNRPRIAPGVALETRKLEWGSEPPPGAFDVVLASDVVYQPHLLEQLLKTLHDLCTPGVTKIYLGYKPRGMDPIQEMEFFATLRHDFRVYELKLDFNVRILQLSMPSR